MMRPAIAALALLAPATACMLSVGPSAPGCGRGPQVVFVWTVNRCDDNTVSTIVGMPDGGCLAAIPQRWSDWPGCPGARALDLDLDLSTLNWTIPSGPPKRLDE